VYLNGSHFAGNLTPEAHQKGSDLIAPIAGHRVIFPKNRLLFALRAGGLH